MMKILSLLYNGCKKAILVVLMASFFAGSMFPLLSIGATAENTVKYGFHVEDDGTVTLNGKEFWGYGENYFQAFKGYHGGSTDAFLTSFSLLKDYNIPFVRLPLSGYGAEYYEQFEKDPEKAFLYMDRVLAKAAENRIGVIVDIMWTQVCDYVGEKRSEMGNIDSKTLEYAKKYTAAIVQRYVDHPAVWGWEIGNEYNLPADLCDPSFQQFVGTTEWETDGFDYYTSEELQLYYTEIAKEIRKYDDYRLITTGNGEMRSNAYGLYTGSQNMDPDTHLWALDWSVDSYDEFDFMNNYYTPDPLDCMCFHLQHGNENGYLLYDLGYFQNSDTDLADYFKAYADVAKKAGKAIFFGEFGDFSNMESDPDCVSNFRLVCQWIKEAGIQIGCAWHFGEPTTEGNHGEKLKILSEMNLGFRAEGKQDTDTYWDLVEDQIPEVEFDAPSIPENGIQLIRINMGGDLWAPQANKWGGPEKEGTAIDENGERVFLHHVLNDEGELEIVSTAVAGTHYFGNFFGTDDVLKPNTHYRVTAEIRFYGGDVAEVDNVLYMFSTAEAKKKPSLVINESENYVTYTYEFLTGDEIQDSCLVIGPSSRFGKEIIGHVNAGIQLYIRSCILEEYVPDETTVTDSSTSTTLPDTEQTAPKDETTTGSDTNKSSSPSSSQQNKDSESTEAPIVSAGGILGIVAVASATAIVITVVIVKKKKKSQRE